MVDKFKKNLRIWKNFDTEKNFYFVEKIKHAYGGADRRVYLS
jgi:molybdopterin synthase catalytic subunit